MAAKESEVSSNLLSIPAEIRWIIYHLLFAGTRIRCDRSIPEFERSSYQWLHLQLPPQFDILLTCRQFLHEGRQHFYQQATFDLNDMTQYDSFFDALPSSIRSHVRAIEGVKVTRGVQTFSTHSMKPDIEDMQRWLPSFPSLAKLTVTIDTIVTLQDERFHGIQSLDGVTYQDVLEIITSPVTSTGRPKWSLKPLIDLIESQSGIDVALIFDLRTVAAHFQRLRSIAKFIIRMDVKNRTIQLADNSLREDVLAGQGQQHQTHANNTVSAGRGGRRIAYTRGGIFVM